MNTHLKIANVLLIVAIVLNLTMVATLFILNEQLSRVSSEVSALEQEANEHLEEIEANVGFLSLNTSEKLKLVDQLMAELESNIIKVGQEGDSLRAELDYATTISRAMESVVLIIWTDNETILGSGFIVSSEGQIMTADHVVDVFKENTSITIRMKNGSQYNSSVVARDNNTDLAILKMNKTGLPYLEFGNSSKLVTGSKVFALGAPEGFGFSATEGIVSAARSVNAILIEVGLDVELGDNVYVIQTDAAITNGNSGGPLIDKYGAVVGINSFGVTVGSGSKYEDVEGLNFAISSNDAKKLMETQV